jgi:leader peptidase (prepilin peptidase) / N-methyltransferase
MLNILFALIGLLTGGLINALADDLPERRPLRRPRCPRCDYTYPPWAWLALVRRFWLGATCPDCELPLRPRLLVVELVTAVIFAALPSLISYPRNLPIYSFYIAVLILVIVIDLEYRLILHVVTFPTTALAILATFVLTDNTWQLALVGAVMGYISFLLVYWLGHMLFGPGALGYGDVTLAMMMGAMLGAHRIVFALVLAILLAGVISLLLIASRRLSLRSHMAYGPYLAIGGIIMIIWGNQILDYYRRTG